VPIKVRKQQRSFSSPPPVFVPRPSRLPSCRRDVRRDNRLRRRQVASAARRAALRAGLRFLTRGVRFAHSRSSRATTMPRQQCRRLFHRHRHSTTPFSRPRPETRCCRRLVIAVHRAFFERTRLRPPLAALSSAAATANQAAVPAMMKAKRKALRGTDSEYSQHATGWWKKNQSLTATQPSRRREASPTTHAAANVLRIRARPEQPLHPVTRDAQRRRALLHAYRVGVFSTRAHEGIMDSRSEWLQREERRLPRRKKALLPGAAPCFVC